MTDETHSFTAARTRLEEIVTQVRKKDTSLEKSLDLLEEGVRLANVCTELIDRADWVSAPVTAESAGAEPSDAESGGDEPAEGESGDEPAEGESGDEPAEGESGDEPAAAVGEVWSDDEAWADETHDDPSDGDDGHGA